MRKIIAATGNSQEAKDVLHSFMLAYWNCGLWIAAFGVVTILLAIIQLYSGRHYVSNAPNKALH